MTDSSPPPEPIDAEIVPDPAPAPPRAPAPDYDERGVPGLEYLRSRIEGRYATALGTTELAGETAAGATADEQFAERERAAAEKLAEIRRSLG